MALLDSFKTNKIAYALLLAIGVTILMVNNLLQFFNYIMEDKRILLLSLIFFTSLMVYLAFNKEALR